MLQPRDDHVEAVGAEVDGVGSEESDIEALQQVLSGQAPVVDSAEQTARCSTYGNTTCDIQDIVVLSGAVKAVPIGPSVADVCLRSVSSEVPSDP